MRQKRGRADLSNRRFRADTTRVSDLTAPRGTLVYEGFERATPYPNAQHQADYTDNSA